MRHAREHWGKKPCYKGWTNRTCRTCPIFSILFFNFLSLSLIISLFYFLHSKGDTRLRAVMLVRGDQELVKLSSRSHGDLELQALNAIEL